MGIPRNFPAGTVSVLLVKTRKIVESQVVQWVDGLDKTGSDGVGNEDLGTKSGGDESVVITGSPQLDVKGLELKQQSESQELVQETQETLSEHEEVTQEALYKQDEAGPAAGSTGLGVPVVSALRKLTIHWQ